MLEHCFSDKLVKYSYMADFQNQKERIKEFISYIGMNNSAFEKSLNLSNGYINSMRKGLGYDKLEQISIAYPELNMGWLLTGEGEMLRPPINETKISPINIDGELINTEMEKEIKRLRASIDALIEKNERLEVELTKYREKESLSKELAG